MGQLNHISALFFISILSLGCSDLSEYEKNQVSEALADSLLSTTETWGVNLEFLDEGYLKINLKGSYASSIQNSDVNETRISGPVHISVYDTSGVLETVVTSNRAVYFPGDSEFKLYGGVEVNTKDNRHLRSEYLKWEQKNDRMSSDQFVIIVTPTDSIAAQGFFGKTDLTDYTIREGSGETTIN